MFKTILFFMAKLLIMLPLSVLAQDQVPTAPMSASSWYEGDLTREWSETIANLEKHGPEFTFGNEASNRVIEDANLFLEAQSAFFHNLPLLNKKLMERVEENFMRGPEWTLEVRLLAGLFPYAYAKSETYGLTFQFDLPSYAPIRHRLEEAFNKYKFGARKNPNAQVKQFSRDGSEIENPSIDGFCPPPLINRVIWYITSCVTYQCPGEYIQYRSSYEECSDGTTRTIEGCHFSFIICPH